MFSSIKPGDEVAIMPSATSPCGDVLEIARIVTVNAVYIQIEAGGCMRRLAANRF